MFWDMLVNGPTAAAAVAAVVTIVRALAAASRIWAAHLAHCYSERQKSEVIVVETPHFTIRSNKVKGVLAAGKAIVDAEKARGANGE